MHRANVMLKTRWYGNIANGHSSMKYKNIYFFQATIGDKSPWDGSHITYCQMTNLESLIIIDFIWYPILSQSPFQCCSFYLSLSSAYQHWLKSGWLKGGGGQSRYENNTNNKMNSEKAKCPNTFVADCNKQVKFGSITGDQYTYDINNIAGWGYKILSRTSEWSSFKSRKNVRRGFETKPPNKYLSRLSNWQADKYFVPRLFALHCKFPSVCFKYLPKRNHFRQHQMSKTTFKVL